MIISFRLYSMRGVILLFFFLFALQQTFAQCKTYRLSTKNDTVNCTDFQNLKQGYWLIDKSKNYGEPGYKEEGNFKDDKKEGEWMRYNLMGDVIADEHYRWGNKDGICRYYNIIGILREESWRAIDPKYPYDTVRVYHLDNPDKYDLKIVKVESSTVRHGTWSYYDPERSTITKTEEYVFDQLIPTTKTKTAVVTKTDSANGKPLDSLTLSNKNKPPEVLEYERKNSKKKKIKVRDGATGVN